MSLTLVEAPEPFLAWSEIDAHLKLDGDESERSLIETYAAAACAALDGPESLTGRPLAPQAWTWRLERLVGDARGRIRLPLRPALELVSIEADGEAVADVVLHGAGALGAAWLEVAGPWPAGAAEIVFRAGYADTPESPPGSGVPRPLRVAALMMVADLHRHRGEAAESHELKTNPAIERLIAPYRVWRS